MTRDVVQEIETDLIKPNPYQPRETFDKEKIQKLAYSLKTAGLLQPIMVRPHNKGYQIALGERRWRAAQMAKLDKLPAIVREMDDKTLQVYSIVENLHREDLTSEEREKAIHELWTRHFKPEGKSMADMGRELGMAEDPSYVADNVSAYEQRKALRIPRGDNIATHDLRAVRGLDTKTQKEILDKKADGTITSRDLDRITPVVRMAKPERQAAVAKEVFKAHANAKDYVKTVEREVEHIAKTGKPRVEIKKITPADERKVMRLASIMSEMKMSATKSFIGTIDHPQMRQKAIKLMYDMEDWLQKQIQLVQKAQEGSWAKR